MSTALSALERQILDIVHTDNRRGRRSTLASIEIALDDAHGLRAGTKVITKSCWDLERLGLLSTVKPAVAISDKGCTVLGKPVETPKAVVVEATPEPVQAKAPVMPPPALRPDSFARIPGETKLQTTVRLLSAYPDGLTAPEARELTGLDLSGLLSQLRNVEKTVFAFYRDGESKLTYKLLPIENADDARPDVAPVTDASPEAGPATAEPSAVVEVAPVADAAPPDVSQWLELALSALVGALNCASPGRYDLLADTWEDALEQVRRLARGREASDEAITDLRKSLADALGVSQDVPTAQLITMVRSLVEDEESLQATAARMIAADLADALGMNIEDTDPSRAVATMLDEVRRRKPVQRIIEEARQRLTSTHSAQMNCLHGAEALLGVR